MNRMDRCIFKKSSSMALVLALSAVSLVSASLFSATALAASCPSVVFKNPSQITLSGKAAMIVTHPSTLWDGRFSSKVGMDAAVAFAKKRNLPVIYLQGDGDPKDTYFFSDCNPTHWVASAGGEFSFDVQTNHIYSVGGHWELCQRNTMDDLLKIWGKSKPVSRTITQVMDGLYSYGAYILHDDPYTKKFTDFMDIISYRKPGQDSWPKRKLNLLEMMGVIQDDKLEVEYLKRGLPEFYLIDPVYEIQLIVNGKMVEVLRKGKGTNPPLFKFEFIDSLYESGYAPAIMEL